MTIDNQGSGSTTYDGLLNTGRGIELGATNDLPIPIHHTLGSELFNNSVIGNTLTVTNITDGKNVVCDGLGTDAPTTASLVYTDTVSHTNLSEELYSFNAVINSGTYVIEGYYNGSSPIMFDSPYTVVDGYNEIEIKNRAGTATVAQLYCNASVAFDADIINVSVKQITNSDSFLTYHDLDTNEVIQLGNSVDGGSSKELVTDYSFDSGISEWTATEGAILSAPEQGQMKIDNLSGRAWAELDSPLQLGKYAIIEIDVEDIDGVTWVVIGNLLSSSIPALHLGVSSVGVSTYVYNGSVNGLSVVVKNQTSTSTTFKSISVKEILPTSTTYTFDDSHGTINNILTHASAFTTADMTAIQANPNLLAKLAMDGDGTISELSVSLGADDAWYACSEESGAYVVDARAGYGSDELSANTWSMLNADETASLTNNTATTFDLAVTSVGTDSVKPLINKTATCDDSNTLYIVDFTATVNSGTAIIARLYNGNFTNLSYQIKDGANKIPLYGGNDTYGLFNIYFDGTNLFSISTSEWQVREATASEIANYASTVRTNADQQTVGLQSTCLTLDGAGVPTAYTVTQLEFHSNEFNDTQWNPSLESSFWIEEIIDNVVYQHKYDGTNLTTYTDNVAGTPSAHSPENASYLMGKGAYPKVTADVLSSYTLKHFLVDVDGYASYSQSARYTVLSAI